MPTTTTPARVRRTAQEQAQRETAAPILSPCGCGCGLQVARSFAPGHDARLKSRLIGLALNGKAAERRAAEKEIGKRGWDSHLDKARQVAEARAEKAAERAAARAEKAAAKPGSSNGKTARPRSLAKPRAVAAPAVDEESGPAIDEDETPGQALDLDSEDPFGDEDEV